MSTSDERHRDQQRLLDALFIDEPTAEVYQAVDALLRSDEQFRRCYVETLLLRANLEWTAVEPPEPKLESKLESESESEIADKGIFRRTAVQGVNFLRRRTPFSMTIAALTVALLITVMSFIAAPYYRQLASTGREPAGNGAFVAQLTGLHEAVWPEGRSATPRGNFLRNGQRLELRSGLVEITFNSGARVIAQGPCDLQLTGKNSCQINSGRVTAKVPKQAIGFLVRGKTYSVVDLGTEFGVAADRVGNLTVQVRSGAVEVQPTDDSASAGPVRLVAPQVTRFAADGSAPRSGGTGGHFFWTHPQTDVDLSRQLVLYLPLDGDLADASGRGNDAQAVGDVEFTSGKFNQALSLRGGNYVTLAKPDDLQFGKDTDFSISLWYRVAGDQSGDPAIISNKNWASGRNRGWAVASAGNGDDPKANVGNGTSRADTPVASNETDIGFDAWVLLVALFDRDGAMTLVRAQEGKKMAMVRGDMSAIGELDTQLPINIGQDGTGEYPRHLTAEIDDLAIWRCALTLADIQHLWSNGRGNVLRGERVEGKE